MQIQAESKSEKKIYDDLSVMIETMTPGDRLLSMRQIMSKYGVSQQKVSQALKKLEQKGLIIRKPYSGIFVSDGSNPAEIRLGLLTPDWPSQTVSELDEMLKNTGKNSGVQTTRQNYQLSDDIHNHLPVRDFDVIAIIPNIDAMTPEFIYKIGTAAIPVILCWIPMREIKINCVSGDPFMLGATAASYLIEKGHRKLAIMLSSYTGFPVCQARIEGFNTIAKTMNCSVKLIDAHVKPGDFAQEKTYDALSSWLDNNEPDFTAMYVLNDETAQSAMRALNDHGITIPGQVSVVGADGSRHAAFYNPSLTTIGVQAGKVAAEIINMTKALTANPKQKLQAYLSPEIYEGNSTRSI